MWGKHVEHSVRESIKNIKGDKQRASRAAAVMRGLLRNPTSEGSPAPKGAFRDPAMMMKGK